MSSGVLNYVGAALSIWTLHQVKEQTRPESRDYKAKIAFIAAQSFDLLAGWFLPLKVRRIANVAATATDFVQHITELDRTIEDRTDGELTLANVNSLSHLERQDVWTLITVLSLPCKGLVIDNKLKGQSNSEITQFFADIPKLLSKLGNGKKVYKFIIEHPRVRETRVGIYCRDIQQHLANYLDGPIHLRRIKFLADRTNQLFPTLPLRVRVQIRSLNPAVITDDLVRSTGMISASVLSSESSRVIIEGYKLYFIEKQDQIRQEADAILHIAGEAIVNAAPEQHNHVPLDTPVQVGARRPAHEALPEEQQHRRNRRRLE
jgi:hypothetical protein